MSGTIETTNNNIIIKINAIIQLLELFQKNGINVDEKSTESISDIKEEYEMGSINILSDYFLISSNYRQTDDTSEKLELSREKELYFTKYQSFIRKENFISKLDRLMQHVKKYIVETVDKNTLQEIYTILKLYNNSTINKNCTVGPFARLRPGSNISEDVHIGNFVEIKNASLGRGVKVNHLSYLGDAKIGERTNIGAGTITCNYDGYNKSETVIGSQSFIGSNTALVAPVVVGDNAIIGAGSVITKDVQDNALSLTRAEQKNIPNYGSKLKRMRKRN